MKKATENNTAYLLLYKSGRKNAKSSDIITINHLISHGCNVPDERIINQIVSTFSKAVYACNMFNHIELSAHATIFKKSQFRNVYGEKRIAYDPCNYHFERRELSCIEQLLNSIFSLYCMVYPYNTIHLETLHSNASIRSIVNQWYA